MNDINLRSILNVLVNREGVTVGENLLDVRGATVNLTDAEQAFLQSLHRDWEPPQNHCHWCGKSDDDNEDDGFGPLVDFQVLVADGEEGYSRVLRYACQDHHEWLADQLVELGFGIHAHGGICFLEDQRCPGYTDLSSSCPTPEEQFD